VSGDPNPATGGGAVSESFCVLPWLHVFADENGVMYPCCRSITSKLPNKNELDGKPYRIQDETGIENGWNSAYMRQLRVDMLTGHRPKPCARCYMYDDLGMRSHRQSQNEAYREHIAKLVAKTDPDGQAPLDIRTVDIRLGNLCNLRCRMCSPQSSKALIREWAALHSVPADHAYFNRLRELDWFSRPAFWRIFERHTANIERLHFAGGEPLLIPQMFMFLDRLIELDRAPHITLSYNTNLSMLPPRLRDLWSHFLSVRVTVSLDGFDHVNTFIRYPSQWPALDHNLKTLDTEAEQFNCGSGLGFNTAVQIYNVFRIGELLDYTSTLKRFEAPNLSILSYPEHFSIRILPAEMKHQAAERLRNTAKRYASQPPPQWGEQQTNKLLASIDGIIDHMLSVDQHDLIPEFCRWTRYMDRARGQRVLEIIPELTPLFKPPYSHSN
jgi:hypothetical protein